MYGTIFELLGCEEDALDCYETSRITNVAIPKVPSGNIVGYLAADTSCVGSSFREVFVRLEGAAEGSNVGIVDGSSVGIKVGDSVIAGVGISVAGDVEGYVVGLPNSARLNTRTFPT